MAAKKSQFRPSLSTTFFNMLLSVLLNLSKTISLVLVERGTQMGDFEQLAQFFSDSGHKWCALIRYTLMPTPLITWTSCANFPGQTLLLVPLDLCQFFPKALQLFVMVPADCENGVIAQNTDTLVMTLNILLHLHVKPGQKNLWVIFSLVLSIPRCPPII